MYAARFFNAAAKKQTITVQYVIVAAYSIWVNVLKVI